MKILHISNGDDCLGSARCLYDLLQSELEEENITPIVITPQMNNMNLWCNSKKITNYVVRYYGFMYPKHDKFYFIKYFIRKMQYYLAKNKALKDLEKLIKLEDIDIIHTNNCIIDLGKVISQKYSIPHVWHLREGGIAPLFLKPYFKKYIQYMQEDTSKFIAVSNATKKEWEKLGIDKEKIIVAYDGIHAHQIPEKKDVNLKEINIIMIGAINETKGQIRLIKALSKMDERYLKKIKIDIYGSGSKEYLKKLITEINRNKLNNVLALKGYIGDIWQVIEKYDVGINCTNFEAFGRVTVEYLMAGIPVIVSNTGANPEIIKNDNLGLKFELEDIDDLRTTLQNMCDNIEFYRQNRDYLHEYAVSNFSSNINTKNIISIFLNEYKGE